MSRYLDSTLIATARLCAALFLAAFSLGTAAAVSTEPAHPANTSTPSPSLDPSEVVRIQVEALRNNSLLNEGIQLTYRFASPDNKRVTGPLIRFTEMVRSAPYDRLLNHLRARYSPLAVSGDQAYQMVIITDAEGEEIAYHWSLSRQIEGEFKDCWMTDAVIPVQRPTQQESVRVPIPWEQAFPWARDNGLSPATRARGAGADHRV